MVYVISRDDYLAHHGILGMKWGKRQGPPYPLDGKQHSAAEKKAGWQKSLDTQKKKVNSLYNHANKWTARKIQKLENKGKTAKAAVAKYMYDENERARKEKLKKMDSVESAKQYRKMRSTDRADFWLGGQKFMKENSTMMSTPMTRLQEYQIQRGMRWMSNFTMEKTLARMTPKEGYDYLRKKAIYNMGYSSGYNSIYRPSYGYY